jgi:hypothetical protein
MIDDIDRLIIIYPAMMQRKNKARSTTSVSSLSGHGSGYDANNDDDDDDGGGGKKSDRGIGGGTNDGRGGGGGGRLRSSIVANGNAVVGGGDSGLLLELTSSATTASTTEISPPPVITSTTKAGGSGGSSSGGGGGGGGGGGVAVLSATVKRNKCGTRPFDARWLNLDCCGLVCAGVTYALHAYGLYAFCFVLLPPWLSETDEDGYREVSERGEVEKEEKGREREFFFFSPLSFLSLPFHANVRQPVSAVRRHVFVFIPRLSMCIYTSPRTPLSRRIASSNRPHEQSNERTNE